MPALGCFYQALVKAASACFSRSSDSSSISRFEEELLCHHLSPFSPSRSSWDGVWLENQIDNPSKADFFRYSGVPEAALAGSLHGALEEFSFFPYPGGMRIRKKFPATRFDSGWVRLEMDGLWRSNCPLMKYLQNGKNVRILERLGCLPEGAWKGKWIRGECNTPCIQIEIVQKNGDVLQTVIQQPKELPNRAGYSMLVKTSVLNRPITFTRLLHQAKPSLAPSLHQRPVRRRRGKRLRLKRIVMDPA